MAEAQRPELPTQILAQKTFWTLRHTYYKIDAIINGKPRSIFSYYPMSPVRVAERAKAIDRAKSLVKDDVTEDYVRESTEAFFTQISTGNLSRTKPVLQNDKYGDFTPLIRQAAYERLYDQTVKYAKYSNASDEE